MAAARSQWGGETAAQPGRARLHVLLAPWGQTWCHRGWGQEGCSAPPPWASQVAGPLQPMLGGPPGALLPLRTEQPAASALHQAASVALGVLRGDSGGQPRHSRTRAHVADPTLGHCRLRTGRAGPSSSHQPSGRGGPRRDGRSHWGSPMGTSCRPTCGPSTGQWLCARKVVSSFLEIIFFSNGDWEMDLVFEKYMDFG